MQTKHNAPIDAILKAIGENLVNHAQQVKLDRLNLAKIADLNRNTVGAALSGHDMKLSTLIRLTRALGHTDWLAPLIASPIPTPLEQLGEKSQSNSPKIRKNKSSETKKPISRDMGRKRKEF